MINNEEVLRQAHSYISQSIGGLEVENSKIDFKAIWYDLTEPKGINEFVKDTSAIANSFGPDGMLIFGYDDKKRQLYNCTFKESGLKDSSQLPDLINKRVDRLFHFNLIEGEVLGYNISIIHIPPSMDKPHVIRNYKTFDKTTLEIKSNEDHKIFIRRGSSTYPASKSDLELMYYDRKNIQSDYEILATSPRDSFSFMLIGMTNDQYFIRAKMNIIMENVGRRPVSICKIRFRMSLFDDPSENEAADFATTMYYVSQPLILQSGELQNFNLELETGRSSIKSVLERLNVEFSNQRKHLRIFNYHVTLSNGEAVNCSLKVI